MKQALMWTFIIIWFFHLLVGAMAIAAAIRIWPERANAFVRYTGIHLNAAILDALGSIVAVFLAKDVIFTWKFSIVVFATILARDLVRLPLLLFILRGPRKSVENEG